jgi:hypothetical protein
MTKHLHVLSDEEGVVCVIFSDVAAVNAAHKRELIRLAHAAGLREPITLVSTSPLQSPLSLAKVGLCEMRPLLYP